MTMYETIFTRRSVRKFNSEPLAAEELGKIKEFLNSQKPLSGCNVRFEIVQKETVNSKMAPHYILAYCDNNTANFINTGFILQNMDLYLQSSGYGSQWLGMNKPLIKENREEFVIMLAFGKTTISKRADEKDFSRLPIEKISNADNEITRAVRLAPSAVNSQPWQLLYKDNSLTISYFGRGILKAMLKGKLNKIDLGIALSHAVLAIENSGKTIKNIDIIEKLPELKISVSY